MSPESLQNEPGASIYDVEVTSLSGEAATLAAYRGDVLLIVNVASKCGFTPQYRGLQDLYETYRADGLSVLGFPCNQFLFQEPGDQDSITACGVGYGVTFPVFGKVLVNGRRRHPLYRLLTSTPDERGKAGRVRWNFEKFLVGRDGHPIRRYRSRLEPGAPELRTDVETALAVSPPRTQ